ncbi:Origin recognition complex subunit 3 [Rattus norvegicus] [Rhizoctonia solani]|uniref:Origin recognition complex subunit 3 [Rattus norvegicus] n=1 Tax=Rhizoctonia solani TaxID=456999 RepID=A0A0K6GHE1_9AGAM|nr:Origin recognition complex subunit 3 [Rattus norvegicus] [Rhizoctonia solani]
MTSVQEKSSLLSATEGTTYIPFKPRKGSGSSKSRIPGGYHQAWGRCQKRINQVVFEQCQDTVNQLVEFAHQHESTQDSGLGIQEIPMALVVGKDRALLSALVSRATHALTHQETSEPTDGKGKQKARAPPLIVQLEEGDCTNTMSTLRALVTGFMAQFEEAAPDNEPTTKKKATATLAPFDMARLVAGYDDYYSSRDDSPNLVVIFDRMEAYDPEVLQDVIYACSKYLDSLPFIFITTLSDSYYLQRAFTTATRAMLDPTILRPTSGAALCVEVVQRALYDYDSPYDILLGESSVKVLKETIDKTDGRIEVLITTLQLIYMEHYRYQGALLEVVPSLHESEPNIAECVQRVNQAEPFLRDALMALMFIYKRRDPLSDGFRLTNLQDLDQTQYTPESMVNKLHAEHVKTVQNMKTLSSGLNMLHHLTWRFNSLGSYRQEVPLGFLDLLELDAKGDDHLEKYTTWMLKKGFENTSLSDSADLVRDIFKTHIARGERDYQLPYSVELSEVANHLWECQVKSLPFGPEDKAQLASYFTKHISFRFGLGHAEPYSELYYTETASGLKETLDPAPRSVILSGLVRPGAYFSCECCDPEESFAPESMAQRPDICVLFQRSLDAGKLLNIADWFGSFVAVVQHEKVERVPAQANTHGLRTRRRRSAEGDGDNDDLVEIQKEYQARFIQSAHELEFLGLIQTTGRRKEHVMRTVFETAD